MSLSTEEVMAGMDSLLTGNFAEEEASNFEESVEIEEEVNDDEDTHIEETAEVEDDTEETGDGESQEDIDETEPEEEEGTTQSVEEGVDGEEEEEIDTESEEESSTDTNSDDVKVGSTETTDTPAVDVEEFNRLKDFYDKLTTTEFTVNGRKKTGFTEVEDLIKAQQAYGGIEKKFGAIKAVKPFMKSLQDNGFIDNPGKYELSIRAGKGDVEAIKQIIADNGIDPLMDLDIDDNFKYTAKNDVVTSEEELAYQDVRDSAEELGVTSKFERVLFEDFDKASQMEMFKDSKTTKAMGTALAEQISNGIYDTVMNKVDSLSIRDKAFASMTTIEKYNAASKLVNEDIANRYRASQEANNRELEQAKAQKEEASKRAEAAKSKIQEERKAKAYKAKVASEEKKVADERAKASSVSKAKTTSTKSKNKKMDIMRSKGDDFRNHFNSLLGL